MTSIEQASQQFMAVAQSLSTLVDIDVASLELWAALTEAPDDTWTPEQREALETRLAELMDQQLQKVDNYTGLIRKLEHLADADDSELKLYRERRDRKRRAVERLKQRLADHIRLVEPERRRIETTRYTLRLQQNPPAAEVVEEMLVPSEFKEIRTSVHIDLNAIKARFKQGEQVPGVVLTRGESLRIS